MVDSKIVSLLWERNELGLDQAKQKYGMYCYKIAFGILSNAGDAEECENDTFLAAWNAIPPERPFYLAAFLGRITRNLSLKRLRSNTAQKRGGNVSVLSLDELSECIPEGYSFEESLQLRELTNRINSFLRQLPAQERNLFIRRYWHCDSISDIAGQFRCSQSKVKMSLLRTREKLRDYLQKEGLFYEKS